MNTSKMAINASRPTASTAPLIMGILNVTPDSFFDGGKYDAADAAVRRAHTMINEGADIIDIGGESTGPGSEDVSEEEELRRIIPVLRTLHSPLSIINYQLSIDTAKASVAGVAIAAGAAIVNDVSAGRSDPTMLPLIAKTGSRMVLMYSKDPSPRTTIADAQYDDVIAAIVSFLQDRIRAAENAGIPQSHLIIDPGLGHFVSSDPRYSWEILERLEELIPLGCPILVSPSRKSFTAEFPGQPAAERLPGTLKATQLALQNGASILRTHDVKETKKLFSEMELQTGKWNNGIAE